MTVVDLINQLCRVSGRNALLWLADSLMVRRREVVKQLSKRTRAYKIDPMKTACDVLNTLDTAHLRNIDAAILLIESTRRGP